MSVLAIACTKNEQDIIESFIRGNSFFVNKFCIFDQSDDCTREILINLRAEGFEIDILTAEKIKYSQSTISTQLMRKFGGGFDHVFLLDADEFVVGSALVDDLSEATKTSRPLRLLWKTFVPVSNRLNESVCFEFRDFRPLVTESRTVQKVAIPRRLIEFGRLPQGNHQFISSSGHPFPEIVGSSRLAHFPIRTSDQFIYKIVKSMAFLARSCAPSGEGFHVRRLWNELKERGFEVNLKLLQEFTLNYAREDQWLSYSDDLLDWNDVTHHDLTLRYSTVSKIRLLDQLASELLWHAEQLGKGSNR